MEGLSLHFRGYCFEEGKWHHGGVIKWGAGNRDDISLFSQGGRSRSNSISVFFPVSFYVGNATNQSPEVHLNRGRPSGCQLCFPHRRGTGQETTIVTWAGLCCLPSTTSPFGVFGAMKDTQELASWLLPRKVVPALLCEVFQWSNVQSHGQGRGEQRYIGRARAKSTHDQMYNFLLQDSFTSWYLNAAHLPLGWSP